MAEKNTLQYIQTFPCCKILLGLKRIQRETLKNTNRDGGSYKLHVHCTLLNTVQTIYLVFIDFNDNTVHCVFTAYTAYITYTAYIVSINIVAYTAHTACTASTAVLGCIEQQGDINCEAFSSI